MMRLLFIRPARPLARRLFVSVVAAILLLRPSLPAQGTPSVTATIEPGEVRPGSPATYVLSIEGGQPDEAPELRLPEGITIAGSGPSFSNQTTINNGVVSQSATFTWTLVPTTRGDFLIPPQEVHIRGKPVRSNGVRLAAKADAATTASPLDPLLTIQVDKRELFLGEVIPVTVTVYAQDRQVSIQRIGLIEIPKDNFAIQRFPLQPEIALVTMGGVRYRAYTFRSTVAALKPGKLTLGPATSEVVFEVPVRGGSMQHPFFVQTEQRTVRPQGNEIEMTVLPLPEKDRPANFRGVVGDFEMSLVAEPRELAIGDPISVEITVTGSGNFDTLSPPELTKPDGWRTYAARRLNIRQADPSGEPIEQRAAFNQVIIPTKAVPEIPPYEFSYFSPTRRQFITARTAPVPLRLREAGPKAEPKPGATATPSGEASPPGRDKVPPPEVKLTDILTVMPGEARWLATRTVPWRDRGFLAWNGVALGILVLLLGGKAGTLLWRASAAAAAQPARQWWRRMREAKTRGAFYQAAAHYLHLRGGPVTDEMRNVLACHERTNFGPSPSEAMAPLPGPERAKVLRILRH